MATVDLERLLAGDIVIRKDVLDVRTDDRAGAWSSSWERSDVTRIRVVPTSRLVPLANVVALVTPIGWMSWLMYGLFEDPELLDYWTVVAVAIGAQAAAFVFQMLAWWLSLLSARLVVTTTRGKHRFRRVRTKEARAVEKRLKGLGFGSVAK